MPSLTSGLPDGAPRYTPNFAPASYDVTVPYIGTRRHTERLWPVDPLAAPRPAFNANSYSGALSSKNNMPNTTTAVPEDRTQRVTERMWLLDPLVAPLPAPNADSYSGALNSNNHRSNPATTVPHNRTHRAVPVVPHPRSNAVGSASMSVTDARGSGESCESQGKKRPENIDRLAQDCAFACQQIEALVSRLDDKLGAVRPQHHKGCTCSCATTAREKQQQQQQEEKEEAQWPSGLKQLLRLFQQQLHRQVRETQEMSSKLARMDERLWLVKTLELQEAIDSLQEEIKQVKYERQIERARAESVAEESRLKQFQEADRVKQLEDAMRRLTHLEHRVDVETGAVTPDQVERDWLLVAQSGMPF